MWHKSADGLLFSSLTMDQFTDLASQNVHTTKLLILNSACVLHFDISVLSSSSLSFLRLLLSTLHKGTHLHAGSGFLKQQYRQESYHTDQLVPPCRENCRSGNICISTCTDFPKVKAPSPTFWFRKSDIKEVLYRGSAIQVWPLNRTVVWRFSARCLFLRHFRKSARSDC